jgi:hypothetical protein
MTIGEPQTLVTQTVAPDVITRSCSITYADGVYTISTTQTSGQAVRFSPLHIKSILFVSVGGIVAKVEYLIRGTTTTNDFVVLPLMLKVDTGTPIDAGRELVFREAARLCTPSAPGVMSFYYLEPGLFWSKVVDCPSCMVAGIPPANLKLTLRDATLIPYVERLEYVFLPTAYFVVTDRERNFDDSIILTLKGPMITDFRGSPSNLGLGRPDADKMAERFLSSYVGTSTNSRQPTFKLMILIFSDRLVREVTDKFVDDAATSRALQAYKTALTAWLRGTPPVCGATAGARAKFLEFTREQAKKLASSTMAPGADPALVTELLEKQMLKAAYDTGQETGYSACAGVGLNVDTDRSIDALTREIARLRQLAGQAYADNLRKTQERDGAVANAQSNFANLERQAARAGTMADALRDQVSSEFRAYQVNRLLLILLLTALILFTTLTLSLAAFGASAMLQTLSYMTALAWAACTAFYVATRPGVLRPL